jgi:hypothetical protein
MSDIATWFLLVGALSTICVTTYYYTPEQPQSVTGFLAVIAFILLAILTRVW